jgi:hypothetical protein
MSTPADRQGRNANDYIADELADLEDLMARHRAGQTRGRGELRTDEEDSIDARSDDSWDNWGSSESGYEQSWGPGVGNDRLDWSRYHVAPHKNLDAAAHDRLDEKARDRLDETDRDLLDRAARDQLDMGGGADLGMNTGY